MLKSFVRSVIRLRGVRHNNLKNFDLDLPLNQLIVVTGLSGSGKSSLAFDTLFAEGQRRYIETFSPYARQFFDRMDKPQADSIEGIPPAIAIEQRNSVRTTRSTVGTMTEICDYMKLLWPHIAQLHCRNCDQIVRQDSPQTIWQGLGVEEHGKKGDAREVLITFDLPLSDKLSLAESLGLISKQGYQRLLINGQMIHLDEAPARLATQASGLKSLTVVQDRLHLAPAARARFTEACEQAYHFGKGKLAIHELASGANSSNFASGRLQPFSNRLHCATCDLEYREPSPALFSFNNPLGACPTCRGFGRVISIDYDLAMPDRSRTLQEGVVKPWQSGMSAECQTDLLRVCRQFKIRMDVPFEKLATKWQRFVIDGAPGYGKDKAHEWPRAWYGVKGYFRWLESKAYKMHVRVLLSRYRAYTPCPDCHGKRFQPEALLYRAAADLSPAAGSITSRSNGSSLTLADFYQLPIRDTLPFIDGLAQARRLRANDPIALVLHEVRSRLGYLDDVGLGYLTLDRPTRSLSGGETERVSLTTCLGTRLVNTLFVLDEPSVGLHPRDTDRLIGILKQLRSAGNTVLVVEHEARVMKAADQIVDLGPGHGATGGQVVFQGTFDEILRAKESVTGQYLSGRKFIELPQRRPVSGSLGASRTYYAERTSDNSLVLNDAPYIRREQRETCPVLTLRHASCHNLRDLTVQIPLSRFVCVTGVSGSGKTTLVREVLLPSLLAKFKSAPLEIKASDRLPPEGDNEDDSPDSALSPQPQSRLEGWEKLGRVVLVDQSLLGKTPRSNPAVYIGAFEDIREVFAQSDLAKQRGLNSSAFSFNSAQGQCERCRGAGFEKIEMQFLSDVFIRCPDCNGRRYRQHILEVKIAPKLAEVEPAGPESKSPLSIADVLESTVDEAVDFMLGFSDSRAAIRAGESLKILQEVGLGYLKLGQPINTLSGGESQRLKLVRHLAEVGIARLNSGQVVRRTSAVRETSGEGGFIPALFLFDEPTTGLHFDDVRVLMKVFQRLVDAGHSVLVIEHNLDVIKSADWVLDLGPEAGDRGGLLVAQGTPEQIAACRESHTGAALREVLPPAAGCRQARTEENHTRRERVLEKSR